MSVYNSNKPKQKLNINKFVGTLLISVSAVFLINLIFNIIPMLNSFLLGSFGVLSYALFCFGIFMGVVAIKKLKVSMPVNQMLLLISMLFVVLLAVHLVTTNFASNNFNDYMLKTYQAKLTAGGVVLSSIVYLFFVILSHSTAVFVAFAILFIVLTGFFVLSYFSPKAKLRSSAQPQFEQPKTKPADKQVLQAETTEGLNTNLYTDADDDDLIIADEDEVFVNDTNNNFKSQIIEDDFSDSEIVSHSDKTTAKTILGLAKQQSENTEKFKNNYIEDLEPTFKQTNSFLNKRPQKILHSEVEENNVKPSKDLNQKDIENLKYLQDITGGVFGKIPETVAEQESHNVVTPKLEEYDVMQDLYDEKVTKNNYQSFNNFNKPAAPIAPATPIIEEENLLDREINQTITSITEPETKINDFNNNNNFGNNNASNNQNTFNNQTPLGGRNYNNGFNNTNAFNNQSNAKANNNFNNQKSDYKQVKFDAVDTTKPKKLYKKPSNYIKPPLDLLKRIINDTVNVNEDNAQKAEILENTLSSFNVPAKVVSITRGPAFTRFELQMNPGVSVKRVQSHSEDIAMTLMARGNIRFEIPIPGKNAFGVEVPNEKIETVPLRDILESTNFQTSSSPLTFALGKDITGDSKVARIEKLPHMLVAGSTGSGKSVCLNTLLISLIYKCSPEDLRLVLIDPKRVEFTLYNGLPHLLLPKVITDIDKALSALSWLIEEMERRYNLFAEARVRNLEEYNNTEEVVNQTKPKMPSIVFIVDEVGDLMLQNKKEVEERIIRITQKSRAAGIYLIIATQRPSVDVITGTIKVNLPSRIAFAVSSFADSKTILDQAGADKLLGKGDMLYSPVDLPDPVRIQGAFVSNEEVGAVVDYVKEHNEPDFDSDIEDEMFNKKQNAYGGGSYGASTEFDPLMKDACRLIIKTGGVSTSKIQRAFALGFPRAGKIVDQMEAAGFISAQDQKKLRVVYITQQEFEERFGEDL